MSVRVDFDPEEMGSAAFYRLLTSLIVPRPIAWVSTISGDGVGNLAPHSLFTAACTDPPVVQFTSVGRKDSLRNVEATGEFAVSFTPYHLFEQINATATDFPADVSEFEQAGLESEPSERIAPPRVAASPAALECRLLDTVSFGNSTVVFGRVVHAVVSESVMGDRNLPDVTKLRPIARLGRNQWTTLGEIREIQRIPFDEWPGHFEGGGDQPGVD